MPLPTFVIAGAQKCGTSSLSATLRQHPQFFMSKPKELHFFDRHFSRGLAWYEDQFAPGPGQSQWGEATPAYIYDAEARSRLAETLPGTKVVVILRDPAKRAYSHYWHSHRLGHEDQPFEEALELEPKRLAEGARATRAQFSYSDRGHYVDQLEDLAAAHGRELVHVMLLEDLIADRTTTLQGLLHFLDADVEPLEAIEEIHTNKYRVRNEKSGKVQPVTYPPMNPATRERLKGQFAGSTQRLADWLGRDLSVWTDG